MPRVEDFVREDVLKKMVLVFHEKGYNATSMQDLVDASQLNRSSIYNSFGNKLSIFLECLRMYQGYLTRETSSILMQSSNSFDAISAIFNLFYDYTVADKDNKGCLLSNCVSEMANQNNQITTFLKHHQDAMLGLFEDLIYQGQQSGEINKNMTHEAYAAYLYSSIQGLRNVGILLNDKRKLKSIIDITLENLK